MFVYAVKHTTGTKDIKRRGYIMSVKDMGYLDYFGIRCVYIQDGMNYILMPTDEKSNIMRHGMEKNYLISFSTELAPNSVISVKQQIGSNINSICLELNYILKSHTAEKFSGFVMVGNEIDQFFSPLEFYFRKHMKHETSQSDLLYDEEKIMQYSFTCDGKKVDVELVYGNLLREGIKSDLVLHPQLIVTFEETRDTDFIYHVSNAIVTMLQFVHRKQAYNLKNLQLFRSTDKGISFCGYMFSSLYQVDLRPSARIDASFVYYGEKLGELLSIIASEPEFSIKHLNKEWSDEFSYSAERLGAVSSAFEYEYKKNAVYPQNSEIDAPVTRTAIVDFISNMEIKESGATKFLELAKSQISGLGKRPGLRQQIINAYKENSRAMDSSINNLLHRHKGSVEDAASTFAKLRGKVLHNEMGYEFDDKESECIRFVSILQFVMVLKRVQYSDAAIEKIIGRAFMCNNSFFDELTE